MHIKRFVLAEHPKEERLEIHSLLSAYHWERINPTHVLVLAQVPARSQHIIQQNEKTLIFPSVHSKKDLHEYAKAEGKEKFCEHLIAMGIQPGHTMSDLVDIVTQRYGNKFAMDI